MPSTTLQQTSSPDITTVSNILYNRTSWTTQHALSSDHLPIITTINIQHDYMLQQNRCTFTNYKKANWTQLTEDRVHIRSDHHTHQHTQCQQFFFKHHTDGRQAQHTKGQDAYHCRLLPDHIVCKIKQRNIIRGANACDLALKTLIKRGDDLRHTQTNGRSHTWSIQ